MEIVRQRIDQRLNELFNFKKVGEWYRRGVCPHCGEKELWTHAETPRVVKCGRINKCGYEEHVRDICEDLFKKWTQDFPKTNDNPHAAADAYLSIGRGLDIQQFKGCYTQEVFQDYKGNTSSTVRFQIAPGIWWERLIDDTKRFEKNFNISLGSKFKGLWWCPPGLDLTAMDEIWVTEGILKSLALMQVGIPSVASISSSNFPDTAIKELAAKCLAAGKKMPTIVWAYDNDKAGRDGTLRNHKQMQELQFSDTAAMPPFSKVKIDWNDLLDRDQLKPEDIKEYRHYGKLVIAKSASEAALLIYNFMGASRKQFYFNHQCRMYWFELNIDKFDKIQSQIVEGNETAKLSDEEIRDKALSQSHSLTEICNAQLTPLYFQRNKATGESEYYFQVVAKWADTKIGYSPDQLATRSRFKPAVMGSLPGAMWTGSENQLEIFVKRETEGLKSVDTIDWVGYSIDHQAYIFKKHAFHKGATVEINDQDYFKVGRKEVKSLAVEPEILFNTKKEFKPDWIKLFLLTKGAKGLVALAWWTGSYFAEQIRAITGSYPFIEIVGQAGAGKTTMLEMFWNLSGRRKYEGFDPNKSTSVAVYRNLEQVANLPVVLLESDRNDDNGNQVQRPKFQWDELKDAFNGRAIRSKGLRTSGNETYEPKFRAAVMISQNDAIKASEAMLTRTLHLTFTTAGQTLQTKRYADQLYAMPFEDASTYITHCLKNEANFLKTYQEKLAEAEDYFHSVGVGHTRIALNHAQMYVLIEAMAKYVFEGYLDLEDVMAAQLQLVEMAKQQVIRIGADHTDVQNFWHVFEYLTQQKNISLNHHSPNEPTVAININQFYEYAIMHKQQIADPNRMRDLLTTSRRYKFQEKNKSVRSHVLADPRDTKNKATTKCWIFQKPVDKY
jgi:hypothetical protein